jgi:HSP20 family protein
MSEQESSKPKQLLISILVLSLVAVVGTQTWYMMEMKKQLNAVQGSHDAVAKMIASNSSASVNKAAISQAPVTQTVIAQAAPSPAAKKPTVAEKIDQSLNAQKQPAQQAQSTPANPPSLFDDPFFNQPNSAQNWNPYAEIERMQREMDRMFNTAFSRFNSSPDFQQLFNDTASVPEMDVQEDNTKYSVSVNVPGVDDKNISVNLDGQQLTVRGQQDFNQQKKDANGNVVFQERHSGTFQRSITLPEPVDQNGMQTHVNNGVLTITIPKVS